MAVRKYPDKKPLKEERLSFNFHFQWDSGHHRGEGVAWWQAQEAGCSYFHPHTGSGEGLRWGEVVSPQSSPSRDVLLPPARLHLLRFHNFPKQHHKLGMKYSNKPMKDCSYSDHCTYSNYMWKRLGSCIVIDSSLLFISASDVKIICG